MSSENLVYNIIPSVFNKEIEIPSSKSYANRALILGALKGDNFILHNLSNSTDVQTMIECLKSIGLIIEQSQNTVIFKNKFPDCEIQSSIPIVLKTGDGGTTNRFLIALLSLGQNEYCLLPSEKMSERPIDDLLNPLKTLGVNIFQDDSKFWVKIKGPIKNFPKEIAINCEKSTQFASAMKLVLDVKNVKINLLNVKSSEAYLLMTDQLIKELKTKNEFFIPIDFSSASYPLALALTLENGNVLLKNCFDKDLFQADSVFLDVIREIGGDYQFTDRGLALSAEKKLRPFVIDGSKCPDLVMTLAYVASKISGTSKFLNLEILKYKESDRLSGILKMLNAFEVDYKFLDSTFTLEINGSSKLISEKRIETERDHRMVMMGYLFLRGNLGGQLLNIDCIQKSFPNFLNIMN